MGTHEHWPFDDPAKADDESRLALTRRVRDQIELLRACSTTPPYVTALKYVT